MNTTPSNPVQSCQPTTTQDPCRHGLSEDCPACMSAQIEELRDVLHRVNYTLVVHGHMDGGTGLHKLVEAVLEPKGEAV